MNNRRINLAIEHIQAMKNIYGLSSAQLESLDFAISALKTIRDSQLCVDTLVPRDTKTQICELLDTIKEML